MAMIKKHRLSKEQAYQKIKHFVSYQERCQQEVRDKLYSYGLYQHEVESLVSQLVEENFLNEERFAELFAGSKFRMKNWGRVKIRYELKQKRISEYCIRNAITSLDKEQYEQAILNLAGKKWEQLNGEKNLFIRKGKLLNYLSGKGYEMDLIRKAIERLANNEK